MTISDNYSPDVSTGNGATTTFTGNWSPLSSTYMVVELETIATGARVTQVLNTDYTLTFTEAGYSITFVTAPPNTKRIIRSRNVAMEQTDTYSTYKGFQGAVIEASLDQVMAVSQDMADAVDRCPKFPTGEEDLDSVLPAAALRANKAMIFDASGNVTVGTDDYEDQATDAAASASAAATSASAASTSATSASNSAAAASASAAAAASSAAEGLYNEVISVAFAASPVVPSLAQEGNLFRVDTSGGNVVINLSALSVYGEDMKYAFVKVTSDGNTITVNRGGSDTIGDGQTSLVISNAFAVFVFIGDAATSNWSTAVQAATLGTMAQQNADAVAITGGTATLNNAGLKLLDTNASHTLGVVPGSNLSADRTLTITTGDANRTLTMTGDATISGTNTGDTAAASQAEMEAASSTTVMVTPGRQKYHPGIAKAWVLFNQTGAIQAAHNVSSVTRTSAGNFTVNFSITMSSLNYAVLATPTNGGSNAATSSLTTTSPGGKSQTSVSLVAVYYDGSFNSFFDPSFSSVMIFGDII